MADNVLVIVSSGKEARGKAMTGMMYAMNAKKHHWLQDVKVIFFGPSEDMIANADEELADVLKEIINLGLEPVACSSYAGKNSIKEQLEKIGMIVDPVGPIISSYIKKGYEIVTF